MKIPQRKLIDSLVDEEEPCLGAAFCTYNFDPAFFEEQILRAVLKVRSDPDEQALAFHEEARAGLQATPVAVIGDASMCRAGRRLPYDLLLVRARTFHPKLALVVYETHARVIIGSCNMTRHGYDENVELVFARDLRYDNTADVATLRELDAFFDQSVALVPRRGSQLRLVQEALRARLGTAAPGGEVDRDYQVLHPFGRSILDRLFDLIPSGATITRVGVLAPFFERDDSEVGERDAMTSLLTSLMERRASAGAILDIGASWIDAALAPAPGAVPPIDSGLGGLWAWSTTEKTAEGNVERIDYLVPLSLGKAQLAYVDARGEKRRCDREDTLAGVETRRLWPVGRPTLRLPTQIVTHLQTRFELKLWLHPSTTLDEKGKVARRALHAKLFVIATKTRGKERTYVLMGSPNASRAAMLRSVEQNGNVELAVAAVVEGAHALVDFVPTLVLAPLDRVQMVEAEQTALEPDPSAWILDAVHDAAAKDLTIEWAKEAPSPLGAWTLSYAGKQLAHGDGPPAEPTVVLPFELLPTSAELKLAAGGREVSVQIRVADLAQLPVAAGLGALGLRELLALLGRRVGTERLATIIAQRGQGAADAMLEAIFGEGFGPIDVFKAWWGIAWELEQSLSVPAFRHRLTGPIGARMVWQRLRDEAGKGHGVDETWVYGCELIRALRRANVPAGPDQPTKVALVGELCAEIETDLSAIQPKAEGRAWLDAVTSFYAREVTGG